MTESEKIRLDIRQMFKRISKMNPNEPISAAALEYRAQIKEKSQLHIISSQMNQQKDRSMGQKIMKNPQKIYKPFFDLNTSFMRSSPQEKYMSNLNSHQALLRQAHKKHQLINQSHSQPQEFQKNIYQQRKLVSQESALSNQIEINQNFEVSLQSNKNIETINQKASIESELKNIQENKIQTENKKLNSFDQSQLIQNKVELEEKMDQLVNAEANKKIIEKEKYQNKQQNISNKITQVNVVKNKIAEPISIFSLNKQERPIANTLFKSEGSNLIFQPKVEMTIFNPAGPVMNKNQKNNNQKASNMNIFSSPAQPSANLFTNKITPGNYSNIFSSNSEKKNEEIKQFSLFSNNNPISSPSTLFQSQTLFSNKLASGGLFSNSESNIFNKSSSTNNVKNEENENEDAEEEDDEGPIEDHDQADPNLSTGSYNYIKTNTTFKQTALKFRMGTKDILENVTISLEQFQGKPDGFLYVRMPNKCIAFCGKILPKVTEVNALSNNKNIQFKKIINNTENNGKIQLTIVKIQFKEQNFGINLINAASKFIHQ